MGMIQRHWLVATILLVCCCLAVSTGAPAQVSTDEIDSLRQEVTRLRQQVENLTFTLQQLRKTDTDAQFRLEAIGNFNYSKISYKSGADGFEVPAYVFTPLEKKGPRRHPALIWLHGGGPRRSRRLLRQIHEAVSGQGLCDHRPGIPGQHRLRQAAL